MNPDDLEFSITQYLDGTLPPLERAALENRLATDPQAQALLAEQRKLNELLAAAPPVPEMNWDRFSQRLSESVALADAPAARTYRIGGGRIALGIAAAACVLIAATLSLMLPRPDHTPPMAPPAAGAQGYASISVLTGEQPHGAPITQIKIGPAPTLAAGTIRRYSDVVVSRPAQVFIAKGQIISQDTSALPY